MPASRSVSQLSCTRRPHLTAFLVALSLIACDSSEEPQLFGLTTEGLVEGIQLNGLRVYRGVPFAAAPHKAAAGRFREPARPRTRNAPLKTTRTAPDCPQPPELYSFGATPREQSEDCLALDIWTPAVTPADALPVLVWVHGGGLLRGSSERPGYDPADFARRGIVVVAIRYRLGALGFLAHPALEKEGASGTYGLSDQLRALEWVHANAAAFGGDPTRITLGGHSAGAASLLPLMASPRAQPLYVAAILQSPVVDPFSVGGRADRYADRNSLLREGVETSRNLGAEDAQALRSVSAASWANSGFTPKLSLDGEAFSSGFRDALAAGSLGHRRLVIGFTDDEPLLFLPMRGIPESESELQARVREETGGRRSDAPDGDDIATRYARFLQTEAFENPVFEIADAATAAGWTVYTYRFSGLHGGARHGTDVVTIFGPQPELQKRTTSAELRTRAQEYWASFITDGEPRATDGGGVQWPPYDSRTGRHIVLSEKIHSRKR